MKTKNEIETIGCIECDYDFNEDHLLNSPEGLKCPQCGLINYPDDDEIE